MMLSGEAKREAPVRMEPHLTCLGLSTSTLVGIVIVPSSMIAFLTSKPTTISNSIPKMGRWFVAFFSMPSKVNGNGN
jgi:hypothetical protein